MPYAPQPSQMEPRPSEPTYGSTMDRMPKLDLGSSEDTYGDTFADREPAQAPSTVTFSPPLSNTPGQQRNVMAEIGKQNAEVDNLLSKLSTSGSRINRQMADKLSNQKDDEDLAAQLRDSLATDQANPQNSEFDENAGYSNAASPIVERAKQTLAANFTRFKAGLTRDDQSALGVWKQKYGEENVKTKNGNIYFRKDAKEKFRRVDPDTFELIGDTLLDLSGPILEGMVSVGSEVAGIAALAAPTIASGGAALPATLPAAAGVAAASGALGSATRTGVMGLLGVQDDTNAWNDAAWSAGLNMTGMGLMKGAAFGGKKVIQKFSDIMGTGQMTRINQLAGIRQAFDEFVGNVLPEGVSKGLKETGEAIGRKGGSLDKAQEVLEAPVSMVYDKATELMNEKGIKTVPVDNLLSKLKETLDEYGIKFGKNGFASLPTGKVSSTVSRDELSQVAELYGKDGIAELERGGVEALNKSQAEKAATTMAFGAENGDQTLKEMAEHYNSLLGAQRINKGVPMDTLRDFIEGYRNKLDLYKNIPKTGKEESAYLALKSAGMSDRNTMLNSLFEGSGLPEEKIWKQSFQTYASKIDDVLGFKTLFNKKESAEQFAKALVQPNNSERILKLKDVLGDGSKEWNAFRGEWLSDFIGKHIDTNSGVLLTGELNKTVKNLGKETVDALLSKEEQVSMRKLIAKGNKIAFTDLLNQEAKANIMDLLPITMISQYAPARVAGLWNLIQGKKAAADFLLDEGLLKAAAEASTKSEKNAILETMGFMRDMVDKMQTAKVTKVNPKTGKKATFDIYVPVVRKTAVQGLNDARTVAPISEDEYKYSPEEENPSAAN